MRLHDQIAGTFQNLGYIDFALASADPSHGIWIRYSRECLLADFQP